MLNLNDHGGSWTGFGGDYSHILGHVGHVEANPGAAADPQYADTYSFFYLNAMRDAMASGIAAGFAKAGVPARKLDIIGFDACLMSEYAVMLVAPQPSDPNRAPRPR